MIPPALTTTATSPLATFGRSPTPLASDAIAADASLAAGTRIPSHLMQHGSGDLPAPGSALSELWAPEAGVDCSALVHGLLASFSVILISELGDKTFIITAIMAMKNSRFLVFLASALALFLMTVLSVGMGVAVTVIPDVYTHYASVVLFLCFGLKMLKEAYDMESGESDEEFDEVERSLADEKSPSQREGVEDKDEAHGGNKDPVDVTCPPLVEPIGKEQPFGQPVEAKSADHSLAAKLKRTIHVAPVIIKVFTMIMVAEWGDRSQISTIILAAREDVVGVFVGSFVGHVLCTGLAVVGGRFVANMISVRTMTLLGGIVFLFFAAYEIISGPEET